MDENHYDDASHVTVQIKTIKLQYLQTHQNFTVCQTWSSKSLLGPACSKWSSQASFAWSPKMKKTTHKWSMGRQQARIQTATVHHYDAVFYNVTEFYTQFDRGYSQTHFFTPKILHFYTHFLPQIVFILYTLFVLNLNITFLYEKLHFFTPFFIPNFVLFYTKFRNLTNFWKIFVL